MRVILTGGGTAGHINPALAIAETIRKNDASALIEFVGIKTGKENDLVPREGYRLHHVKSMGIKRSLSPSNIKALWLAMTSPYSKDTVKIIKDFRPDLVIGTGGYAFHGPFEHISVEGMDKIVEILTNIVKIYAKGK